MVNLEEPQPCLFEVVVWFVSVFALTHDTGFVGLGEHTHLGMLYLEAFVVIT